jgi:DNA-binding PadR family transcriptional regulator
MRQTAVRPICVDVLTGRIRSVYSGPMSVPSVPNTLLALIEREPSHGYELKREYDNYFGRTRPLPFGQVYATLSRLVRDNKVSPGEVEPGEGPDRKRYTITDAGREEVEEWLAAPVDPDPYLQTVLFVKVVLALMLDREAGTYLETQRALHLQHMRRATELKRKGDVMDGLVADHALFHLEADLRWMELTEARMSALAAEVAR